MKKVAVVTARSLATYQKFGYEIGKILPVIDSYERNGIKWFRFMGPHDMPEICHEEYFDMKVATYTEIASDPLEAALRALYEYLQPEAKRTLELEATMSISSEDVAESIGSHLIELIENGCDMQLERIAASIVNPELEKTETL